MAKSLLECDDEQCAFDRGKKCAALNVKECKGCRFFKTEAQFAEGKRKAAERLEKMPQETRKHYNSVYGSKMAKY